jgi:hypothetical protein
VGVKSRKARIRGRSRFASRSALSTRREFGDEQGSDSFDTSDLLTSFCGFAEAIASVADQSALISPRSKRLVHEPVTCAPERGP